MFFFTSNMQSINLNFMFVLFTSGYINQVKSECVSPFVNGDPKTFCYYYENTSVSWSDGYNQCLNEPVNGILMELHSIEQLNALKNLNMAEIGSFWLGANNFASFLDSQWHWLDGSIIDNSVVTWCSNSTHDTAIGTNCVAYNNAFNCLTNYPCNTLLPTPCVAATSIVRRQAKAALTPRVASSVSCTNAYGGAYANWWTYSVLLLNWFILFCFTLYITNRLNLNKTTVIITTSLILLSFMVIITFAILWGVQYQNILPISLTVVILGSMACLLFLVDILILVSNHTRVQRWMPCMIASIITIIIESLLMLGLILCIAYCSGYISLASTVIDKDILAALLASIAAAISIIFYNVVNFLLGYTGQDRVDVARLSQQNPSVPWLTTMGGSGSQTNQNGDGFHRDKVERATSPVDERIINEFYSDQPRTMHQYQLEGRQYVVYEGNSYSDIEPYRRDLTQAMLSQEAQGLQESIARAKVSPHATALADEIRQAENLLTQLQ